MRPDALGLLEGEPMKEYLNKLTDGTYKLVVLSGVIDGVEGLIEVPEGAESLTECFDDGELFRLWWKEEYKICIGYDEDWFNIHRDVGDYLEEQSGSKVVWSRHTQPEELPFVDDELNIETATGYQLDIIGQKTYGSRSRSNWESDISYRQYLMNFIVDRKNGQSINDQYAEIEQVRQEAHAWANRPVGRCQTVPIDAKPNQTTINAMNEADALIADTLNGRQSTYGSFEDVALTTQKIMDAIAWARGQDKLPAPHYEALHMIASKMARIVNGDHNHKDSWHDIAGYATLVERLL